MNALTTLKNAEQALVQQIDRATAAVDAIGTDAEAALDRFRQSADLARVRLADVMAGMEGILRGLTAAFAHESSEIEADLAHAGQQDEATARARGVLLGLIDAALAHEEAQLNADDAHEPRQDVTETVPAPESSTPSIASQQATEHATEDDDANMVDLGWEPSEADLAHEEDEVQAVANPPVERDDRPTPPSTTRRRGRGGKSGKKGGR
jgi:hypothetical protein